MMHAVDELGDFVKNRSTRLPSDGQPLPEGLRWAIEWLSGYDMSDVRVYYASDAPARVGARALAQGSDIYVQTGAEEALPHEVWHVVQQMQGRVEATIEVNGRLVNDDPLLEKEADEMGAMAAALSWSGMWRRVKGVLTKGRIEKTVVQRIVTIGATIISTAAAIRDKLNNWHDVTANNTPHLMQIINDIVAKERTFADLETLKNEVKRRSFGLRLADTMEVLRQRQETAKTTYMQTEGIATIDDLVAAVAKKRKNSSSRKLLSNNNRNQPAAFTFIHWMAPTYMNQVPITPFARRTDIYRWLRAPANVVPYGMNCWEMVLYSGTWTDGGARVAIYSRDYALFALQHATTPARSFENPNEKINVPYYVKHVIDHSTYHATNRDENGRQRDLPIPEDIEAGTIVVLNSGQHVALATGRRRDITEASARNRYPGQGHEIIELDGATDWMIVTTLEDAMSRGYSIELHLGRFPDVEQQTAIRIQDSQLTDLLTADVPVTRLYT